MSSAGDVYLGLRQVFLQTQRSNLEPGNYPDVYGLLFEAASPAGVVSLATTAQGDASVYQSTGGGAIGGIGNPEAREAAKAIVSLGAQLIDRASLGRDTAPPEAGQISVALLTDAGVKSFRVDASTRFLATDPLVELIRQAGALVTLMMRARPAEGKR
jgi:hypothetical protein